jgi:hypothetical protein
LHYQVFQLEHESVGIDEKLIKVCRAHTSQINTLTQKHHDEVAMLHAQVSRSE